MLRKIGKWLLILLGVLLLLALVLVGLIVWSRSSDIADASELMGPAPETLTIDGHTFRDLNKNGQLDPYEDSRVAVEDRVEDLLSQMTLEEKAGLMFHTSISPGSDGEIAGPWDLMNFFPTEVALFDRKMSYFNLFFLDDAQQTARWTNNVQRMAERTRLGIPVTLSSDPRHTTEMAVASFAMEGFTKWPEALGLASLRDPALTEQFGRIAAREYRAVGIHMALHPMADLATEPRWGRTAGTFGENAELSGAMTAAYVRGFQGEELGPHSVATVVKHFSGGGPQEDGFDAHFREGQNQVYPGNNFDYHVIPFRIAFEENPAAVMPYYGVPVGQTSQDVAFGFNREILTDLLRDDMGYEGIVLSDWNLLTETDIAGISLESLAPVMGIKNYGVEDLTPEQRALVAINAGVDQFGGDSSPEYIVSLVESGELSEARVDQSARRLLALKFRLGLFDNPFVDEDAVSQMVDRPADRALGLLTQARSQVLLANPVADGASSPILPLARNTRIFVQGLDPEVAAQFGTVVDDLDDADVAIVNLDVPYGHDMPSTYVVRQGRLYFTEDELEPLLEIARAKPTVFTITLERPFILTPLADEGAALLGNFRVEPQAIFQVLFGEVEPAGRLPFDLPRTWQSVLDQAPDVPGDAANPLYCYGFGRNFTAALPAEQPTAAPDEEGGDDQ